MIQRQSQKQCKAYVTRRGIKADQATLTAVLCSLKFGVSIEVPLVPMLESFLQTESVPLL